MKRIVLHAVIGASVLVFTAAPSFAHTCPKLIAEINQEVGKRFDKTAAEAKVEAAEAMKLHQAGKHDESEKVARQALQQLGIQAH